MVPAVGGVVGVVRLERVLEAAAAVAAVVAAGLAVQAQPWVGLGCTCQGLGMGEQSRAEPN